MKKLFHHPRSAAGALIAALAVVVLCIGYAGAQDVPGADDDRAGVTETSDTPQRDAFGSDTIPTKNLLTVLRDGGPLMYPILACSFLLLVFVFERSISLRKGRVIPKPFVKRILDQLAEGQLDRDRALELCEVNKSPTAEVFSAAIKKWGRSSVEVEQAIIDAGERITNGLRRYLRLFNGIATVTPLLGLLGTVLGMIQAFNSIAVADAMGRPELLAKGISQALLTTAAGLTVAIPALIAYLFFVGKVDRLIIEIDSLGQELVNSIASDGVPTPKRERKSSSKSKKSSSQSDSTRAA